ncbi:MAG: response regulator [Myxococcota bacterium]
MAKDVLIIEAEDALAHSVSEALRQRGLTTRVTADGREGLDLAQAQRPDAIVLCAELPRMSGYSICAKLKKDPDLRTVPLLFTSSEASESTFEHHKKLKVRADEYLSKPYDIPRLVDLLGQHVLMDEMDEIELEEEIPMAEDYGFELDGAPTPHGGQAGFDVDRAIADAAAILQEAPGELESDGLMEPPEIMPDPAEPSEMLGHDGAAPDRPSEVGLDANSEMARDPTGAEHGGWGNHGGAAQRELDAARRKISELETRLSQIPSASGPSASREVLGLKRELNHKDHAILELRDQLHTKDKEILGLRERENELESQLVQLEEDRDTEIARGKRLDHELSDTKAALDETTVRAEQSEHRGSELQHQLDQTQRQLEETLSERDGYRERSETLANEKAAAEAESQNLRTELADAQRRCEEMERRITDLEETRDRLYRDRDGLQQRLDETERTADLERVRNREVGENARKARQAIQIALKMLEEVDAEDDGDGPAAVASLRTS